MGALFEKNGVPPEQKILIYLLGTPESVGEIQLSITTPNGRGTAVVNTNDLTIIID